MATSVTLSRQKLEIDDAARAIRSKICELEYDEKILLAGIKAIDNNNEDMFDDQSLLGGEVRKVMRKLSMGL